jgi:ankyrin repeat protein/mono/diheme cytochrome c family protein
MRSVVAPRARSISVASVLGLLATLYFIDTRPTAGSDDKPATKPLTTELAKAIRDGDLKAVRAQLDAGVDVNARDADGNTPLLLTAVYAGPECVELLIKKGADVNAKNKLGATPLHRAATSYEKAKLLIDAGADARAKTKSGRTPLTLAARKAGNSQTVKLLLDNGADAKERNARGINPIQVAAACGDLDTVKLLVEAGADVNDFTAVSGPGAPVLSVRTPLGWAAFRNDVPMVRYLLERKADPNKATPFGTPLTWAAWGNSAQAAEVLLAHGAKADVKSSVDGSTALHWAAGSEMSAPDLVKLLLKHGADPNAEYGEQIDKFLGVAQTPRLIAEKRGQTALVEALIAAGAKAPSKPRPVERSVKPIPEKPDAQRLRDSAESAIRLLQESAVVSSESARRHASRQGRGSCLTCHQHFLPLAAMGQARDRAVRLDRDAVTRLGDQVALGIPVPLDVAEVDLFLDQVTAIAYMAFGLIGDHRPASAVTDKWVHQLAVVQAADGRWPAFVPRPPMQASDVSTTALAIQVIRHYGWAGRKAEFDAAVDRGRQWLWTVKAETTEDAAYQLLGLHWAGEPAEKLVELATAILSQQRKDGGWAQLPTLESDAYATGQALYALARAAKHATTNRDWQQGLRFLLGTQRDDGSWHVVSRAYPFQPTMDSGFPHGRDSWISAAGTSWAVLAMTEALPLGTTNEKPAAVAKKPKDAPPVAAEKVDFAKQIKPLLERSCIACHGPDKQRSNFRVDSRATLLKGGNSGSAAVVPEKSAQSPLMDYLNGRVEGMEMPPMPRRDKFAALTKEEVELVRAWIEQGAAWPADVILGPRKGEKPR